MTHNEAVTAIDTAITKVLDRIAIVKAAANYHARYLSTGTPGLEHHLCAELYMALNANRDLRSAYVEFPGNRTDTPAPGAHKRGKGNSVSKVDLAIEFKDTWLYVEVKLGDKVRSQKDLNKLHDLVGEAERPICVCLHCGLSAVGRKEVEAFFDSKIKSLGKRLRGSRKTIAGGQAYFVRFAFWMPPPPKSLLSAAKAKHASEVISQRSMSPNTRSSLSKILRNRAEKEALTGCKVLRPKRKV